MINKFIQKWCEFSSHNDISNLSDEVKVALFKTFLEIIKADKPSVAKSEVNPPFKQIRKSRPATFKQINFIKKLIKESKLDEIDTHNLTVGEASDLISKGMQNKGMQAKPEPEPEPQGKFVGSYNHKSGASDSSAEFWE